MRHDKKCINCSRIYRGEGFKIDDSDEVCTRDCFFFHEYHYERSKFRGYKKPRSKFSSLHQEKQEKRKDKKNEKISEKITKKNHDWMTSVPKEESKSRYKINAFLEKKKIYPQGTGSWDKKFKSVRG